jgi:hypothetical protein
LAAVRPLKCLLSGTRPHIAASLRDGERRIVTTTDAARRRPATEVIYEMRSSCRYPARQSAACFVLGPGDGLLMTIGFDRRRRQK